MDSLRLPLTIENGSQVFSLIGTVRGQGFITLDVGAPVTGSMTIESRLIGQVDWRPVPYAASVAISPGATFETYGLVHELRITFADVVTPTPAILWVTKAASRGFPDGAFEGTRALTMQPYTEANVKRGLQYNGRAVWNSSDPILAGTTRKIWFATGDKTVIVKLRDFHYVAEALTLQIFVGPTGVVGGTPLTIHNYNTVNPVATTVQAKKNVTTTTDGVEIDGGDPEHFFGATPVGARSQISIPEGRERIIMPNAEFIVAITNIGTGSALAQYFLDWYEGDPDLPT